MITPKQRKFLHAFRQNPRSLREISAEIGATLDQVGNWVLKNKRFETAMNAIRRGQAAAARVEGEMAAEQAARRILEMLHSDPIDRDTLETLRRTYNDLQKSPPVNSPEAQADPVHPSVSSEEAEQLLNLIHGEDESAPLPGEAAPADPMIPVAPD